MSNKQPFFQVILIIFILFYATTAFPQIEEFSIEPAGHFGGNVSCGSVQGNYAYLGQGVHLTVLDITTDPPQQVAGLEMADAMFDLTIAGDFVYLYLKNGAGLAVVNIATPEAPVQVDSLALPGGNNGALFVSGNRLYAATDGGLYILDISVPATPVILGSNAEAVNDVVIVGTTAYCVASNTLKIYDVSGASPAPLASAPASGARGVTANETHAFVAAGFLKQDVLIFDISDPANPQQTSRFTANPPSGFANPISILVENDIAWVGCSNWLLALDIADPANPAALNYLESVGWVIGIEKSNDDLYLFQRNSDTPYRKISAADPSNPAVLANFASPWDVKHILADDNQLFIASEKRLWLYDITEQDQPRLVSSRTEWADARHLAKNGDILYALQRSALFIIDISDPQSMTELGMFQPVTGELREITVQNDTAYILLHDTPSRLEILDVSNPAAVNRVGSADFNGSGVDIFKHPNTGSAFVAYNNGAADRGCTIFDCSDPENPQQAGSFSTASDPACLWADQDTVFIGSNDNSYILEAFDVSDARSPAKINQNTGNGLIRDMEMRGGLLFAGVEGGSVHVWGRGTIFTIYQICPSPSTIGVTVTTPATATTTTSSGAAYTTEGSTYKSSSDQVENSGSEGVVIQKYLIVWRNMGGLVTSVAPTAEAGTASPPSASGPIGAPVKVKAVATTGWAFTHWVNASPPNEREAFALLGNPPTEVVAHFQPILTLSAGALNPGYTMVCPAEDENDSTQTPVIQIQLTASQADDWEVSGVGFQVEGNLEAKHVRRANLHLGSEFGPILASTNYGTQFSFSVPPPFNRISAGSGVTFMITFDFEDKSTLVFDQDPVQFTVFTNRTFIGATAVEYPPGVILPGIPPIPTVQGGPVSLGCVHNIDSKQAYLFFNEAINAEATQDHHTLTVCPGVYEEFVDVTKSLTIQSMKGAETTTVRGQFDINKDDVTIDGFTVNGAGAGLTGVKVDKNNAVLKNLIVERWEDGIVFFVESGDKLLEISGSEIRNNNASGITCGNNAGKDSLILNQVHINGNKEYGIWTTCPTVINGHSVVISGNQGSGIGFERNLTIRGTDIAITKNTGWGLQNIGMLLLPKPNVTMRADININENTAGGIFDNNPEIGAGVVIEKNGGNGITAENSLTAKTILIKDNQGWGIETKNDITIKGEKSEIHNNEKGGIVSAEGDIAVSCQDIDIAGNHGDGVLAAKGDITVSALTIIIKNNTGWGISTSESGLVDYLASKGNITFTEHAQIAGNDSGGVKANNSVHMRHGATINKNGGVGILAGESVSALNLFVTENQGDGIRAGLVELSGQDNKIQFNSGDGILCSSLRMSGFAQGYGNSISNNQGWGIKAGNIEFSHPVAIERNRKGGIDTQELLNLPDHFAVEFNGGIGIRSVFGITATNLKVELNDGDGIVSFGKTVLLGKKTSISVNSGNGLVVDNPGRASLYMLGGKVRANSKYGIVYSTHTPPTIFQTDVSGNQMGGIYHKTSSGESAAGLHEMQGAHIGEKSHAALKPMANIQNPLISSCLISSNLGDGILFEGEADLNVSQTSFVNNGGFGINNQSQSSIVTADDNWWGAAEGPDAGDGISGNVDVATWLEQPIALTAFAAWDTVYTPAATSDTVLCVFQNWEAFDDVVDITISDDLGWIEMTPFTLAFQDSAGADTLIRYTVPDNLPLGTANTVRITAVSQTDNSWTAADSFVVIIYESSLVKVAVTPDSVTLTPGQTMLFQAHGLDTHERSIPVEVNWSATGGVIDSTGLFTAGEIEGTFQVTATEQSGQLTGAAVVVISLTTDIAGTDKRIIPDRFALSQNYPNPFNPVTSIEYSVKEPCRVQLVVYNIQGRLVQTLVNSNRSAGIYTVHFDARRLAGGIYFYRILMKDFTEVKKMVVVE